MPSRESRTVRAATRRRPGLLCSCRIDCSRPQLPHARQKFDCTADTHANVHICQTLPIRSAGTGHGRLAETIGRSDAATLVARQSNNTTCPRTNLVIIDLLQDGNERRRELERPKLDGEWKEMTTATVQFQELSRTERTKVKQDIANAALSLLINSGPMLRRDLVNKMVDNNVHYSQSVINFGLQVGISSQILECDDRDYVSALGKSGT